MSFFTKFKPGSGSTASQSAQATAQAKKDKEKEAISATALEKHIASLSGPVRPDGSDKYFGFENYGSTCYANSIIQCLYYSAPFREHMVNFPSQGFVEPDVSKSNGGADKPPAPQRPPSATFLPNPTAIPYPNATSPARKPQIASSPGPGGLRPEENKDSPEFRKRLALSTGPVLALTQPNETPQQQDEEESLFTSLRDIFSAIIGHDSRTGVVSPHRFLEILRVQNESFRSTGLHQDAHEFLNILLNRVVDYVDDAAKQNAGQSRNLNGAAPEHDNGAAVQPILSTTSGEGIHWVHDLFRGLLTSETRCLTCETTSQRSEPFLDLSLDLLPHSSVTACFAKFSAEEMLCSRNKFHCDTCGGLQEAEKRMKVKRLPRVLIVHLKRFEYTFSEDAPPRLEKLFHKVVYPFHLRLFNTTDDAVDPDRLYELYGVVVHIGGGPYHGHYVSIIKTHDRGWLLFDDELVEPVDKEFVLSFFGGEPVPGMQDARQLACAYVLFYQETTLESVLKEQEEEGMGKEQVPVTRTSESEAKDAGPKAANGDGSGLHHTQTVTTPTTNGMEHMESLAHAASAPILMASPTNTTFPHLSKSNPNPNPSLIPSKTKKELKAEQKAEEKERKSKEKADLKALEAKRREQTLKRMEAFRKQEEEMKRAVEESKLMAAREAEEVSRKGRDDGAAAVAIPLGNGSASENGKNGDKHKGSLGREGGLARFRNGSISLRGRPRIFGKMSSAEKEKKNESATPTIVEPGLVSLPAGSTKAALVDHSSSAVMTEDDGGTALTALPNLAGDGEEKAKGGAGRHRFSLGRKKSQGLL